MNEKAGKIEGKHGVVFAIKGEINENASIPPVIIAPVVAIIIPVAVPPIIVAPIVVSSTAAAVIITGVATVVRTRVIRTLIYSHSLDTVAYGMRLKAYIHCAWAAHSSDLEWVSSHGNVWPRTQNKDE